MPRVRKHRRKLKGKWFRGNVYSMTADQLVASKKYEEGVLKPTALEVTKKNRKIYSRYYYKPLSPDENWD